MSPPVGNDANAATRIGPSDAPASDPTSDPANRAVLGRVARGGGFAAVGSAVGAALGLCLTLVVTHSLAPTSAGQFFSTTAVFIVLQTFLAFGAGAGLVRFIPRFTALGRSADIPSLLLVAFVPVAILGAAGSLALWLGAGTLATRIGHGDAAALVPTFEIVAALFLPSTLEIAAVECTRGFGSIRKYVLIQQFGVPLMRPVLVLTATALGFPLWGIVLMWLVPLVVALVLSGFVVRSSLRARLGPTWSRSRPTTARSLIAREYWSFTAARGTAMVMETLLTWLDVILVASMVSASQAAIYAAASRFITSGTLVLQALRLALAADISAALARHQLGRVSEMYRTATQWVVLSSWPLYLVMALFAPTVLQIFGRSYAGGATAMTILCLAMMVNLAAGNVGTVLLMGGKSAWVLADKTACLAVNVGLNLALIPHLGITGAAIAWAATIVLDSALAFGQVRWGMRVTGRLDSIALAAGLSVGCFGLVALVGRLSFGSSVICLVTSTFVGVALYLVPVWRWRRRLGLDLLLAAVRPGSSAASPPGRVDRVVA